MVCTIRVFHPVASGFLAQQIAPEFPFSLSCFFRFFHKNRVAGVSFHICPIKSSHNIRVILPLYCCKILEVRLFCVKRRYPQQIPRIVELAYALPVEPVEGVVKR